MGQDLPLETEGSRAEARAEQSWRELVEHVPEGIFVCGPDGRFTYVNPAGVKMLGGVASSAISGETFASLFRSDSTVVVAPDVDGTRWELLRSDGSRLSVEVDRRTLPDGRCVVTVRDATRSRRLEHELREAVADLDRAQMVSRTGSWWTDVRTNEVRWSAEVHRIFGIPPGQVTFEAIRARLHPEDRPAIDRSWEAATLRGERYDLEHRLVVGDQVKWVVLRGDVIFDAEGKPVELIGTVQDVTHLKQKEQLLRLSEERLSGIIDISADAIISIDEEQHITLFNEGAEKIFGYARDEVLGAPLDILIPERSRAAHRLAVQRFATGSAVSRRMGQRGTPIRGRRKDGEEFPAAAAISKLDVGGKLSTTVILRDMTEEVRHLEESRFFARVGEEIAASLDPNAVLVALARLGASFIGDACAVDVIDEHGGFRRIASIPADPTGATTIALSERGLDADESHLRAVVLSSKEGCLDVDGASGSTSPRSLMAVPLVARDKMLAVLFFASARGGNPFRDADLALARELARRGAIAADNACLYRTAREAIEGRDRVMSIVAHDLRTPLSVIRLDSELLQATAGTNGSRVRATSRSIQRAAKRMQHLIDDLLDTATIDAGALALSCERVPPSTLFHDVLEAERALATKASLTLDVETRRDLPDVWADRERLLQVFDNLVGNAIKFTKAGGHIAVGAAPKDDQVVFWVTDTGCGIAADQIPHLFDWLWRAEHGDRRGIGAGLFVVKGIVAAHGGRIWVESEAGGGSTFFFTIPTVRAPDAPSTRSQSFDARRGHREDVGVDDALPSANHP